VDVGVGVGVGVNFHQRALRTLVLMCGGLLAALQQQNHCVNAGVCVGVCSAVELRAGRVLPPLPPRNSTAHSNARMCVRVW